MHAEYNPPIPPLAGFGKGGRGWANSENFGPLKNADLPLMTVLNNAQEIFRNGNYAKAKTWYEKALITVDDSGEEYESWEAHLGLGYISVMQTEDDAASLEALRHFQTASRLSPTYHQSEKLWFITATNLETGKILFEVMNSMSSRYPTFRQPTLVLCNNLFYCAKNQNLPDLQQQMEDVRLGNLVVFRRSV